MGITVIEQQKRGKKSKLQIKNQSETIILILPNHHKLENKLGIGNLCISCKLCKLTLCKFLNNLCDNLGHKDN